jgi:DNA-binding transcriptional LysR family regulator
MRLALVLAVAATLLGGCERFPRDPEGTLQRISSERTFRVGIIASAHQAQLPPEAARLLQRISSASGARPQIRSGEAEVLLDSLEQGDLDLVLGRFNKKSPWATLVTFGPPLKVEKMGETTFETSAAMRNGENAWVALVERETRNVAPKPE